MVRQEAPAVLVQVGIKDYLRALNTAQWALPLVRESTSTVAEVAVNFAQEYWRLVRHLGKGVADDVLQARILRDHLHIRIAKSGNDTVGGFVVLSGKLMGLWAPRRGSWIIQEAIRLGADRLDCFDGFLPGLYSQHGFREVLREPNRTKGKPDVVWMRRS